MVANKEGPKHAENQGMLDLIKAGVMMLTRHESVDPEMKRKY